MVQAQTPVRLSSMADTWLDVDELERPKGLSLSFSLCVMSKPSLSLTVLSGLRGRLWLWTYRLHMVAKWISVPGAIHILNDVIHRMIRPHSSPV